MANDVYETDCVMNNLDRKYTINDSGGTDRLNINQGRGGFKFFFDVNRNGKVVGRDLYIFLGDSSEANDFMSYITNKGTLPDTDSDCIIIKIFFNPNGANNVNYGSGCIEYISDNNNNVATISLIDNITQQVASWLSANTSYSSVSAMFNDSNLTNGAEKLYDLAYTYTYNWTASGNWNSSLPH